MRMWLRPEPKRGQVDPQRLSQRTCVLEPYLNVFGFEAADDGLCDAGFFFQLLLRQASAPPRRSKMNRSHSREY